MHIRMDTQSNFDWTQLKAFLATADAGSLSAAARVLNVAQPTVGRQVAALEADLGVMLFERAGRGLTLTASGVDLLEHARAMEAAATKVSLVASGRSQAIDGMVRITASDVFSAHLLPKILHHIRAAAPLLQIELVAANDVRDLLRREADIAIRHLRPEQPDLIARKICDAAAYFYASESYVARNGAPETLEALATHDFISFGDPDRMIGHLAPLGVPLTAERFRYGSESGLVAWQLAREGFGIAPMSRVLGDSTPGMVRLLPQEPPLLFPVWLVTHRELHSSRRIRLVYDTLAEHLVGL